MKVVIMPDRTHNPFDEIYRVSRLRENLTSGSEGEGLETGLRSTLNGHAGGNPGHSQGYSYGLPRQSFTRQPTFSDFKSRGFDLEASQLDHADRMERLILIMSLAMYWCVRVGRDDAKHRPTPLEKKTQAQTDPNHLSFRKLYRSAVSWFKRGLRRLKRCLQNDLPLPSFCEVMRN
jgi:hypothetical protein